MVAILVASSACALGCRSQQLGYDQNQFRQVLLGMYEDQLMDNLIRAKNRMPLLHLDYTNITGTVTHSGTASLGGGPTGTRTSTFAAKAGSFVRTASQTLTYGVNASQINQLTVTANPILDNSALYLAYVNFVERPGRLIESCDPPPEGAAHVVRQTGKKFYWVPEEYRNEFLEVALRTNGVRTDPSDSAAYYEATVIGAIRFAPKTGVVPEGESAVITLSITNVLPKDDGVPNDFGWMTAVLDGRQWQFRLDETRMIDLPDSEKDKYKDNTKKGDAKNDKKPEYGNGTLTRTLKITYVFDSTVESNEEKPRREDEGLRRAPFQPNELARALANTAVRLEFDHYRPTKPALEDTLGSIRTQTELLRLNQLQLLK